MKEITGRSKVFHQNLPNNLKINKKSITDKKIIADKFNEFFINIGSNLAAKMPPSNIKLTHISHTSVKFLLRNL